MLSSGLSFGLFPEKINFHLANIDTNLLRLLNMVLSKAMNIQSPNLKQI